MEISNQPERKNLGDESIDEFQEFLAALDTQGAPKFDPSEHPTVSVSGCATGRGLAFEEKDATTYDINGKAQQIDETGSVVERDGADDTSASPNPASTRQRSVSAFRLETTGVGIFSELPPGEEDRDWSIDPNEIPSTPLSRIQAGAILLSDRGKTPSITDNSTQTGEQSLGTTKRAKTWQTPPGFGLFPKTTSNRLDNTSTLLTPSLLNRYSHARWQQMRLDRRKLQEPRSRRSRLPCRDYPRGKS